MAEPKVPVTITYRNPGTKPPLYVAGSFSSPQWVDHLMDYTTGDDGEHTFTKKLEVQPDSKFQYKLRIGDGDWWVLNEDSPIVTDALGNRNNLLESPPLEKHASPATTAEETTPTAKSENDDILEKGNEAEPPHSTPEDITRSETAAEVADSAALVNPETKENADTSEAPNAVESIHTTQEDISQSETAAEVADSAALVDPKPDNGDIPAKSDNAESQSTPEDISRSDTAAEVADSAALVDPETKENAETSEAPDTVESVHHATQEDVSQSETAAEVADSAALVDPKPDNGDIPAKSDNAESPLSTPEDVSRSDTAAEVADSAALLDPEDNEKEISDEVAGQIGFRRMSSTPVPEIANTASEVADTAKTLDHDEPEAHPDKAPAIHKSIAGIKDDAKDDDLDSDDETPGSENRAPLFAHECVGLYEGDEIPGEHEVQSRGETTNGDHHDDFDDPTLERFPSNKDEIISTVRKVETGLNADQTTFEGVPPSPVVGPRKNSVADHPGENLSPETSPVVPRGGIRLGVPKKTSSLSERSLSAVSLGSIAESAELEEEESAAKEIAPAVENLASADEAIKVAKEAEGEVPLHRLHTSLSPIVTVPPSTQATTAPKSPVSDEDEAVVMKSGKSKNTSEAAKPGYLTPERAATPVSEEPGSPREPVPNAAPPVAADVLLEPDQTTIVPENVEALSPRIVLSTPEASQPEELSLSSPPPAENGVEAVGKPATVNGHQEVDSEDAATSKSAGVAETAPAENGVEATDNSTTVGESANAGSQDGATTTGVEEPAKSNLVKRGARPSSAERSGTPTSINQAGQDAAKSGNWFMAFFRLIFVDWIGGFVSKLFGGKRETLVTGVALVAVGAAMWWRTEEIL